MPLIDPDTGDVYQMVREKAAGSPQETRSEVDPASPTDEEGSTLTEATEAEIANRRALAAVSVLVLESWGDDDFLAFSNAVLLWGRVAPQNRSFSLAVEARLCKENGNLWDREALEMAVGHELRRRFPEALR